MRWGGRRGYFALSRYTSISTVFARAGRAENSLPPARSPARSRWRSRRGRSTCYSPQPRSNSTPRLPGANRGIVLWRGRRRARVHTPCRRQWAATLRSHAALRRCGARGTERELRSTRHLTSRRARPPLPQRGRSGADHQAVVAPTRQSTVRRAWRESPPRRDGRDGGPIARRCRPPGAGSRAPRGLVDGRQPSQIRQRAATASRAGIYSNERANLTYTSRQVQPSTRSLVARRRTAASSRLESPEFSHRHQQLRQIRRGLGPAARRYLARLAFIEAGSRRRCVASKSAKMRHRERSATSVERERAHKQRAAEEDACAASARRSREHQRRDDRDASPTSGAAIARLRVAAPARWKLRLSSAAADVEAG